MFLICPSITLSTLSSHPALGRLVETVLLAYEGSSLRIMRLKGQWNSPVRVAKPYSNALGTIGGFNPGLQNSDDFEFHPLSGAFRRRPEST